MSKQTITIIPGDGIGPEITKAALTVLDAVGADLAGGATTGEITDALIERIEAG